MNLAMHLAMKRPRLEARVKGISCDVSILGGATQVDLQLRIVEKLMEQRCVPSLQIRYLSQLARDHRSVYVHEQFHQRMQRECCCCSLKGSRYNHHHLTMQVVQSSGHLQDRTGARHTSWDPGQSLLIIRCRKVIRGRSHGWTYWLVAVVLLVQYL